MGRAKSQHAIDPARIETWLRAREDPRARVTRLHPLGESDEGALKAYGYGRPLCVEYEVEGEPRRRVLRTMSPDPFGHDRRSDRAAVLLGAYDVWPMLPRHLQATEVGAFDDDGAMVPMAHGELFLMSEYVDGHLYATDLDKLHDADEASELDLLRAEALARYLVELHAHPADPSLYRRCIRDTIGSGEGLFGLADSYPDDHPVATLERLEELELAAVPWRYRLRDLGRRCSRTHGDFHPFNILFREGADLTLLDGSRGGVGDPADDLTALSINYLFFALVHRLRFDGAYRQLWDRFWSVYLELTADMEVLTVTPPFFAWRGLVVASPVWYPAVPDPVRDALLGFVEQVLLTGRFHPEDVEEFLP